MFGLQLGGLGVQANAPAQPTESVTADSNLVTADSNLVTADAA